MNSAEYQALNQCYDFLVDWAIPSIKEIAEKLTTHGILARSDTLFLKNQAHEDDAKAHRILDAVLNQVKSSPEVYHIFLEVLEGFSSQVQKKALNKIKERYATLTASKGAQVPNKPGVLPSEQNLMGKKKTDSGTPSKGGDEPDSGSADDQVRSKKQTTLQSYEMRRAADGTHGRALIINIEKYDDPKLNRYGSGKDRDALEKTLSGLGYQVVVEENLKGHEIITKIFDHAKGRKDCDSFICCILAHGEKDQIKGSDGELTIIKEISLKLTEVDHLRNKPKLFFLQACQGQNLPPPMNVDAPGALTIDTAFPTLPRDSDFFWGFSTTYETCSMRDVNTGSLYIQNLCKVLDEYYTIEDLVTMVTRVHFNVSGKPYTVEHQGKRYEYQQQPQLISNLRRLVQFD